MAQEAEFGAEQTHAFGLEAGCLFCALAVADIGVEGHKGAICHSAGAVEVGQFLAVGVLFGQVAVLVGDLGVDGTFVGVNVDFGAVFDVGDALGGNDSGQAKAASKNRGVGLGAAVGGDEGDDILGIEGGGVCRGQVDSCQDEGVS